MDIKQIKKEFKKKKIGKMIFLHGQTICSRLNIIIMESVEKKFMSFKF